MKYYVNLDYLQFSTLTQVWRQSGLMRTEKSAKRFYKTQYVYSDGTVIHTGNPNSEKALFVLSGAALSNVFSDYGGHSTFLNWVASLSDITVSRMDIAITMEKEEGDSVVYDRQWLCDRIREGKVKTALLNGGWRMIVDGQSSNIETLYIGNLKERGKKGIFRAYDKGLEAGGQTNFLSRYELEERQEKADNTFKRWAGGESLVSLFKSRVMIDDYGFNEIFRDKPALLTRDRSEKETEEEAYMNRWRWLTESIAPVLGKAMAREIMETGEQKNYALYRAEVVKAMETELRRMLTD